MRVAWATDIHCNFVGMQRTREFAARLSAVSDACVITGDIAEAPNLLATLDAFSEGFGEKHVYFVLGNHDFYNGSLTQVRRMVDGYAQKSRWLHWLDPGDVHSLGEVDLCGCDGWYDAQFGRPESSSVFLNDWRLISELRDALQTGTLIQKLREMGQQSAMQAREALNMTTAKRVIFATHVPPFREASTYGGKVSNDDFLPWFTNKALGSTLRQWAEQHPERELTVLCGHSHGESTHRELPNLLVKTGGAEYGRPAMAELIDTERVTT